MKRLNGVAVASAIAAARMLGAQGESPVPRDTAVRTTLGAELGYASFDSGIDPWRTGSLSLSHRGPRGSTVGRINVATRFGTTGVQVEADAYPRFGSGKYLYLNAGVSRSAVFPGERFGTEFWTALPGAWEASAGLRALWFDGDPVTLYTGTVGKYAGNYWLSLRPFVRVKPTGAAASVGMTVRRYTTDADNYVGARASVGSSPSDNVTPDAVARTGSTSFNLQGSHTIGRSLIGTWIAGHDSEELDAGRARNSWTLSLGIAYRY